MSLSGGSDSDSSDTELDEEMELGGSEEEWKALEERLKDSPNDYNLHVELIALFRKIGELEKLREARNRMSLAFPLTPKLWLEWLQDEIGMGTEAGEVRQLFSHAVDDYVSFDVWLEYVQWAIGALDPAGVREVFELATTAVGLQVDKGKLLWDAYRELEMALVGAIDPADTVQMELQHGRISSLFKRQLSIPLIGMEETYAELMEYLTSIGKTDGSDAVELQYNKAKSQLAKLLPFEDKLSRNEAVEVYQEYISFERKNGDPSRVICMFERSVAANSLSFQLWIDYGKYLDREAKIGNLTVKLYSRAVRNCPWVTQLWTSYLAALEKYPTAESDKWAKIAAAFEQSLAGGFSSVAEGIDLWLTYAYSVRRKIHSSTGSNDYSQLSEVLQRGADALKDIFAQESDPTGLYRKSWAYLEGKCCGNVAKMRELWADILGSGHSRFASVWLEYFSCERQLGGGDIEAQRKLLLKAVHSASDYPESVCHQLIQFEREEGSLDSLEAATIRVEQQLGRVNERRAQQEKQKRKNLPPPKVDKRKQMKEASVPVGSKIAPESTATPKIPVSLKRPAAPPEKQVDTEGFAIPAGPPAVKKPRMNDLASPNPTASVSSTGNGRQQHDTSKYPQTVFLSNLDFRMDEPEERLREIFSPVGEIAEIRLVRHKTGRFRGFAFVEFTRVESVAEALKLDRRRIDGRSIYVSKCEDKREQKQLGLDGTFKFATGLEKRKLYVRNIPIGATEAQLREIFQPYGAVKEVRLAEFKNGKPKGWAFVEFDDETSASRALMTTDGTVLNGRPLSVELSNPPPRKDRHTAAATPMAMPTAAELQMKFTPALGGRGSQSGQFSAEADPKVADVRRERLDVFKPRQVGKALQGKTAALSPVKANAKEEESNGDATPKDVTEGSKLSNHQFRDLFMKK